MSVFTVESRERICDQVLDLAASDERVVGAAVIGSLAYGAGDRWSDLDLTFAVDDEVSVDDVLADWTRTLGSELGARHLFDLRSGDSLYRVFLLPGCLQLDVSFTPAAAFGPAGPRFRLLYGEAAEKPQAPQPDPDELFGYAVHHVLRARVCIERGRFWQAEYWIAESRNLALALACRSRDLPAQYGRGFDDLPARIRDALSASLVSSLDREELLRALEVVVRRLLREAKKGRELAKKVEPDLRLLTATWDP